MWTTIFVVVIQSRSQGDKRGVLTMVRFLHLSASSSSSLRALMMQMILWSQASRKCNLLPLIGSSIFQCLADVQTIQTQSHMACCCACVRVCQTGSSRDTQYCDTQSDSTHEFSLHKCFVSLSVLQVWMVWSWVKEQQRAGIKKKKRQGAECVVIFLY